MAILTSRRLGTKGDERRVFSDESGVPVGRFRTAWVTAVLKAYGVKPEWKSHNWTALTPPCQEHFRRIDLRWHDLRHEYASRLVERGVPLAQVRDLLGHASITTTERYDNQKLENLRTAALKLQVFFGTSTRCARTLEPKLMCSTSGTWKIGWEAGIRTRSKAIF